MEQRWAGSGATRTSVEPVFVLAGNVQAVFHQAASQLTSLPHPASWPPVALSSPRCHTSSTPVLPKSFSGARVLGWHPHPPQVCPASSALSCSPIHLDSHCSPRPRPSTLAPANWAHPSGPLRSFLSRWHLSLFGHDLLRVAYPQEGPLVCSPSFFSGSSVFFGSLRALGIYSTATERGSLLCCFLFLHSGRGHSAGLPLSSAQPGTL